MAFVNFDDGGAWLIDGRKKLQVGEWVRGMLGTGTYGIQPIREAIEGHPLRRWIFGQLDDEMERRRNRPHIQSTKHCSRTSDAPVQPVPFEVGQVRQSFEGDDAAQFEVTRAEPGRVDLFCLRTGAVITMSGRDRSVVGNARRGLNPETWAPLLPVIVDRDVKPENVAPNDERPVVKVGQRWRFDTGGDPWEAVVEGPDPKAPDKSWLMRRDDGARKYMHVFLGDQMRHWTMVKDGDVFRETNVDLTEPIADRLGYLKGAPVNDVVAEAAKRAREHATAALNAGPTLPLPHIPSGPRLSFDSEIGLAEDLPESPRAAFERAIREEAQNRPEWIAADVWLGMLVNATADEYLPPNFRCEAISSGTMRAVVAAIARDLRERETLREAERVAMGWRRAR